MSGNFGSPAHSEYPNPENESAFNYDWAVPAQPQPSPFEFTVNAQAIPVPGDPLATSIGSVNAKVPIPRSAQASSWISSGRVSRACENCRDQKIKCSGHRPACHRCQDAGVSCSYGDRKKEKMLKQLQELTARVETLDALLRNLYPRLDASSAQQVDQTLSELGPNTELGKGNTPALLTTPSTNIPYLRILSSRANPSPGALFPGIGDCSEEDFDGDKKVQAMGFVGEHSEMSWLYRLKRGLDDDSSKATKQTPMRPSMSSVNYFQDDSDILALGDIDIDLTCRPPQHIANRLVDAYFQFVNPTFPIIGKAIFLNQYRSFYANPNVRPGKRWIAVLNLVFAIATRHSLLIDQPQPDCDDHRTYFARACKLSVETSLLGQPDLQQAQVEGLAGFYLLSVGQVNKSWRIVGTAIRSAVTMGLHIRSESDSITHLAKELRYRIWWALFMLDIVLCEMTGRPPSTEDIFCTTPLPVPFPEEDFWDERVVQLISDQETRSALFTSLLFDIPASPKENPTLKSSARDEPGKGKEEDTRNQTRTAIPTPNTSLYFLYVLDLACLLREAINIIYAPGSTRQSWHEVEAAISTLNNHADNWLSRLPPSFHFTTLGTTQPFLQQRANLAFRFYSTKLIILQPCVRRLFQLRQEVSSPGTVCDQMAAICVHVAGQMLNLLPGETDFTWLYGVAPWWCIVHNIMQSITILLTELSTRAHPSTTPVADITYQISKGIRWLKDISSKDPCSQRAWHVCMGIISRHGSKFEFYDPVL
ncbi:uncharacterized protein N7515_003846 [Penicillium bovifimosum]|uniref:Zn(2)-C6 fungal-type domain-containing protein n=1 Tax=Penicillium bovifimosum TaxID=126998 RepID=A0A9W9H5W4_9EURO|nr:uncharacterized protein N7515_003846 [Penicillium bovifimosum]KAJ5138998.1 hypothetical protein N7515_003846 [Penicillium bovifimosum]